MKEEIEKELKEIQKKTPVGVGKIIHYLGSASKKMEKAYKNFQRNESFKAENNEFSAQRWIEESIKSLKNAKQDLQKRQQLLSGQNIMGSKTMKEYGGTGGMPKEENVKIPGRKHSISSTRQEIMKSIKEGFPKPFKPYNEKYLKNLME